MQHHLRRQVLRGAAEGGRGVLDGLRVEGGHLLGQAEVGQLHVAEAVQQDVLRFQIPSQMANTELVASFSAIKQRYKRTKSSK